MLSQQQKDNDANSKLEMFNFSIVPRLSQPRPLPSFCCGGVVREALLSVRVRTGRCPLGTERKNSVQGLWTLSRAKGSRALLSCATVDSRRPGHYVARVSRHALCVTTPGWTCWTWDSCGAAHELRVLKAPAAGWLVIPIPTMCSFTKQHDLF